MHLYIDAVPEDEASGAVAAQYARDRNVWGFLPNFSRAFSLHPEAYAAWQQLIGAIRGDMDVRRCELATLAAAKVLGTTYCSVAHGRILRDRHLDAATVTQLMHDHHRAGLDDVDVAVMDFAAKVAASPATISEADVDELRRHGLDDRDVLDVVLAVAARTFFATVVESLCAQADPELTAGLEYELLDALVVGRPPAASPPTASPPTAPA